MTEFTTYIARVTPIQRRERYPLRPVWRAVGRWDIMPLTWPLSALPHAGCRPVIHSGPLAIIVMTSRLESLRRGAPADPGSAGSSCTASRPRFAHLDLPLRRAVRTRLLPGLFLLLLSACGGVEKYPQTAMDPKSDFGVAIDDLQNLTIVLGSIVGVLVFLILVYSLVRFRYRPGDPTPNQVHGNTTLELAWTLIPALLLAAISVPTTRTIFFTYRDAPPGALEVDVRGYQWWWSFSYPLANGDTVVTANEIHVPVGQPVVLKLNSNDVIHSFWIPQMGGKRDVIPRRTNTLVFTPSEAGVYLGQCAEFCGDSHALMRMRLIAHEPAEYAAWLENESRPAVESTDSAVLVGKKLVTAGACIACHTIEGTDAKFGKTGPNLTHLARRSTIAAGLMENNAENLTKWITDPQAVKPGALMPAHLVPEQEIKYVVAYLQTLY